MLIGTSQSISTNIVEYVMDGNGRYPAMVIEGIDQGDCDLVVFGAPGPAKPGEQPKRMGAQFIQAVPFGQKNRDQNRKGLYPYWETR